jgi:hypothetical protein
MTNQYQWGVARLMVYAALMLALVFFATPHWY